jgi:DMSO/TMAO reductase YedYZ molybdopterin-dependent catalytic subunit
MTAILSPAAFRLVSYGEGLYGGTYYDTQAISSVLKPGCMLAYEMNGSKLPEEYGAPRALGDDFRTLDIRVDAGL